MALICNATTPEELRGEIVALILHHAWQETAFADKLYGKRETAKREHAARELRNLADELKAMTLVNAWPPGLRESN